MPELFNLLAYGPTGWGDEILAGASLTIRLAVATLPVGLALGFLVALAKRSHLRLVRGFGEAFSTIFRALPELLTLFIIYYGGQILLQAIVRRDGAEGALHEAELGAGAGDEADSAFLGLEI